MIAASRVSVRPASVSRGARTVTVCRASLMQKAQLAAATIAVTAGVMVGPALADGVAFAGVKDGAKVDSPVHVEFSVSGMTVKPAAEGPADKTGHFHVLIDQGATPEGEAIPFDATHLHYGKGQTEDNIALTSGKHTLTLQFANSAHQSYGPKFAKTISVNVK